MSDGDSNELGRGVGAGRQAAATLEEIASAGFVDADRLHAASILWLGLAERDPEQCASAITESRVVGSAARDYVVAEQDAYDLLDEPHLVYRCRRLAAEYPII